MTTQSVSIKAYKASDFITRLLIHLFLLIVGLLCILPMLLVVSYSFSEDVLVAEHGISLLPQGFTTAAYEFILKDPSQILRSYGVTIVVAATGTAGGLFVTSLLGYALSRSYFKLRGVITFYCVFTMLFSGGMIATYLIVRVVLGLYNNLFALILPTMIIPWYVMMFKTHFASLPNEILESARIDGAGEWILFFRIALPLSKPWIGTIGLMYILKYWNEWIPAMLYIENPNLYPLQYLLQVIQRNVQALQAVVEGAGAQVKIPGPSLRMAMVVVAAGPGMFVFMLLQKYFVRGVTSGALKG